MISPIAFTSKIIDFNSLKSKENNQKPTQTGLTQDIFEKRTKEIDNQLSLEEAQLKKKDPFGYFIEKIDEKNYELQNGLIKAVDIVQNFFRPLIKNSEIENALLEAHKQQRDDDLEVFYELADSFFPLLLKCLEGEQNAIGMVEDLIANIDSIYDEYGYGDYDDSQTYLIHVNELDEALEEKKITSIRDEIKKQVDEAFVGEWTPELGINFKADNNLDFNHVRQYLEWMLEEVQKHLEKDNEICAKAGYKLIKEDESDNDE